jgi:hypothetical protein
MVSTAFLPEKQPGGGADRAEHGRRASDALEAGFGHMLAER